jgi:hypothetical protein
MLLFKLPMVNKPFPHDFLEASCHLLLSKINSFILFQIVHIVISLSKVHKELNFLTLLSKQTLFKLQGFFELNSI